MIELVTFILVLTVFLVAYGIVSQGLLYLQRKSDWIILKDIIYYPYWQFYGELFLDEIDSELFYSFEKNFFGVDKYTKVFHLY
jgi:transient receptor potential cation channel subfamily M protein 2